MQCDAISKQARRDFSAQTNAKGPTAGRKQAAFMPLSVTNRPGKKVLLETWTTCRALYDPKARAAAHRKQAVSLRFISARAAAIVRHTAHFKHLGGMEILQPSTLHLQKRGARWTRSANRHGESCKRRPGSLAKRGGRGTAAAQLETRTRGRPSHYRPMPSSRATTSTGSSCTRREKLKDEKQRRHGACGAKAVKVHDGTNPPLSYPFNP